jgi:hypothetical protein
MQYSGAQGLALLIMQVRALASSLLVGDVDGWDRRLVCRSSGVEGLAPCVLDDHPHEVVFCWHHWRLQLRVWRCS